MKIILHIIFILHITVLLLFSSFNSSAQTKGPNLLLNADFSALHYLATNWYPKDFYWADNWICQSDKVLWGFYEYPNFVLNTYVYQNEHSTYPTVGLWNGTACEGTMYQVVTGLTDGAYEFTLKAAGGNRAKSPCVMFVTGFGGDSIGINVDFASSGYKINKLGPINVTNGECKVAIYSKNDDTGAGTANEGLLPWGNLLSLDFHKTDIANSIAFVSAPSQITPNGNNLLSIRYQAEQDGIIWAGLFNKESQVIAESSAYPVKSGVGAIAEIYLSFSGVPIENDYYWEAQLRDISEVSLKSVMQTGISVSAGTLKDSIKIISYELANAGAVKYLAYYSGNAVDSVKTCLMKSDSSLTYAGSVKRVHNGSEILDFTVTPYSILMPGNYTISADLYYNGSILKNSKLFFSKSQSQIGDNLLINAEFSSMREPWFVNFQGSQFNWPENWVYVSEYIGWGQYAYPCFKCVRTDDNIGHIGTWTCNSSSMGTMYQELTGLANGTYEFSARSTGNSKYSDCVLFATGYGGDSIATNIEMTGSEALYKTGPIHVISGKCKVGLYVKNRPGNPVADSDFNSLNFQLIESTGININTDKYFNMYPNPISVTGTLNIEDQQNSLSNIIIMNIQGVVIFSKIFQNIASLNMAEMNLKTGVYYVKLNQTVRKLIVVNY